MGQKPGKLTKATCRENCLGQEGLERCGCRPMPPGGQKVKKKKNKKKFGVLCAYDKFSLNISLYFGECHFHFLKLCNIHILLYK
jgi:hypothetical protein